MNFRSVFLALGFSVVVATTLCAQEKHIKDPSESQVLNTQAYIELLRTDLNAQRRQVINETMQLDDKQARIFWPIYNDYEASLDRLADEKLAIVQDYATNFLTMTNEKADELAQRGDGARRPKNGPSPEVLRSHEKVVTCDSCGPFLSGRKPNPVARRSEDRFESAYH